MWWNFVHISIVAPRFQFEKRILFLCHNWQLLYVFGNHLIRFYLAYQLTILPCQLPVANCLLNYCLAHCQLLVAYWKKLPALGRNSSKYDLGMIPNMKNMGI